MTMVVVIMIGAGVLFVASALENQSLFNTFNKIVANQPINWSGATPSSSTTTQTSASTTPPSTNSSGPIVSL